ncbi:hypothetical protein PGTUg99_011207 [Puccinia graminis f. sp. tritici]|uniref:Uncharacterized protein n=1 Tax=Puccinia graminis f. sp. tritici TaxID=56615 RepID=A0A5B0MRY8_PUCGR|nr:hypothetical protein PGTUg99_011207 [Puccinia graminis f. sp. tritici]
MVSPTPLLHHPARFPIHQTLPKAHLQAIQPSLSLHPTSKSRSGHFVCFASSPSNPPKVIPPSDRIGRYRFIHPKSSEPSRRHTSD